MDDPRVELSTLTCGEAAPILAALDSVQLVIEAPPERCQSREDQVALYNLVSSASRLFPHLELRLPAAVACTLAPLAESDLREELLALHADLAPEPTVELAWGMNPTGEGLAGDASGWRASVGGAGLRQLGRRSLAQSDSQPLNLSAKAWRPHQPGV